MLRVGITGGIGSGKSVIARVFRSLGIPVYQADEASRRLMEEDPSLKASIIQKFGKEAYDGDKLNRAYLSKLVFADKQQLDSLNQLVHPATIRDAEQWMLRQQGPYALKEAALIFESGSQATLDLVIGVSAPIDTRIGRIIARDGISREETMRRINNQLDDTVKMRLCDYVIINDDRQPVLPQVLNLHEKLLEMAKEKTARK